MPERRAAGAGPGLAGLAALPGARGEAQEFHLHATALQGAGEDVGADRRDHDRPAAHGAGVVDQDGDHGVAEFGVLFLFEGQGRGRIDDDAGEARDVQQAFFEVKGPRAVLLGHQLALQAVGEARDDAG